MSKFKLNDEVEVINNGMTYSTYDTWATKHGLNKWVERFSPNDGTIGTVVAVGKHEHNGKTLYAVEYYDKQFIISEDGLDVQKTPAQKAGLVIGNRYYVDPDSWSGSAGKAVYFVLDDGSDSPFFGDTPDKEDYAPKLEHVKPYVEPENTVITFNKVLTEEQIAAIKTLVGE